MQDQEFTFAYEFAKYDDVHNVVIGWAVVCKVNGKEYFDTQGDSFTEDAAFDAALAFAEQGAVAKVMHQGEQVGHMRFVIPLTTEVIKSIGILPDGVEPAKTGVLVGFKPYEKNLGLITLFKNGTLKGFSVGGIVLPGGFQLVQVSLETGEVVL